MTGRGAAWVLCWVLAVGSVACAEEPEPVTVGTHGKLQRAAEDVEHDFAVGIKRATVDSSICSGVLLGPNLVVTARHCVATLESPIIDCETSTFGELVATADLQVTRAARMDADAGYLKVAQIIAPPNVEVCGADIAFLILDTAVAAARYSTPVLTPFEANLSDSQPASLIAIGHGSTSPEDTQGLSIGVRRIKRGVSLTCVGPDDAEDACSTARGHLTATEFLVADAGACSGDSGSAVYDARLAEHEEWASLGVLSRGGTKDGACVDSVYVRFDSWSELFVDAATQASARGEYALPTWASRLRGSSSVERNPVDGCSLSPAHATASLRGCAGWLLTTGAFGLSRLRRPGKLGLRRGRLRGSSGLGQSR